MGEHIALINHIEDATQVYIIDADNVPQKQKSEVVEISNRLGLKVHYLNTDLIEDGVLRDVIDGKYKPTIMEKSKSEDLEK